MNTMIKNTKLLEINKNFQDDLIEYKCLSCIKNYQKKIDEQLKKNSNFLMHTHFLTMISISVFYCCKKVFTHMNTWMIGKNSMKHNDLKRKIFRVT